MDKGNDSLGELEDIYSNKKNNHNDSQENDKSDKADSYQVDFLKGKLNEEKMKILRSSKALHLYGLRSYEDKSHSKYFRKRALIVSPDVINPQIEILTFQVCLLEDSHIQDIGQFLYLKELEIILGAITDLGVEYIAQLPLLVHLNLNSNKITDVGVQSISKNSPT
eukprot:TRINITY_DN25182_c0_g1_i1.p1 TRINITY_DN25182_c0_g1~~TRINITY_DN25182_c0_g1_i1.p1  ORF type:complete len:175 (-),score=38.07 TRINITY_DN25182_c0_g1_i1:160-657(-)